MMQELQVTTGDYISLSSPVCSCVLSTGHLAACIFVQYTVTVGALAERGN